MTDPNTADEIGRLQRCINDLIGVLALPAIWSGSRPSQILGTLLDVLLATLRLDFAYARLSDSSDVQLIEVVRLADRPHPSVQAQEVGKALSHWLTGNQTASRLLVPIPVGEGQVSIASFSLGPQDDVSVLVAGSRRADFPTDIERLLLRVAANQAVIGFQEARRSGEQKRVAEALEQRVAERTRQLSAVNEELRRSEAYLAEAQRLSLTGSFGWNVSSGDLFWSEETFRIFGYDRSTKPTVERVVQRVHPDDAAQVKQTIERASLDEKDFIHDYRLVMADGSVKHVHVVAHALSDESGAVELVGTVVDVTERKEAEAALQEKARLLDLTHDTIFVRGMNDVITYWNRGAEAFYGWTAAEAVGKATTHELLHTEFPAPLDQIDEELLRTGRWEGELVHTKADGTKAVVASRWALLSDPQGKPLAVLETNNDVTSSKQAAQALREQEVELRQLLDLSPQLVFVLGAERGSTVSGISVNQAALDYHGLTLEEWPSTERRTLVHPDDWERAVSERDRRFSAGAPYATELRLRRHDGQYRWFLVRFNPLRDEQGRVTRWYVSATDIEERKQAEVRLQHENVALREEIDKASMFEEIVGGSPPLQAVLVRVAKVASTDSTVLITGETGTGKELFARAIHKGSPRAARAFVSVNCAAVPHSLIASELFGHEKGAFTGAQQRRLGRFELAEGGTLFLDEVGELPLETQVALLRALQEREFERVGGTQTVRVDVRVIAATNRNLETAIAAGTFRNDLFYRLNVFPIEAPALRDRRGDIPVLVSYFVDRYASRQGKKIRTVTKGSLDLLQAYDWPGNIRELQNVIERSVIVCDTETLVVDESWLVREGPSPSQALTVELTSHEKELIEAALTESRGRVSGPTGAAAKLGVPASTLESKIRALKISKHRFKDA